MGYNFNRVNNESRKNEYKGMVVTMSTRKTLITSFPIQKKIVTCLGIAGTIFIPKQVTILV